MALLQSALCHIPSPGLGQRYLPPSATPTPRPGPVQLPLASPPDLLWEKPAPASCLPACPHPGIYLPWGLPAALGWLRRQGAEVSTLSPPLQAADHVLMCMLSVLPEALLHTCNAGAHLCLPSEQAGAGSVCAQKSCSELEPVTLRVQGAKVQSSPFVIPHFQDVYVGGMLSTSRTKGDAERDSASQHSTNVTSEMLLLRTTWTSVFGPFKWTFG